MKRMKYSERSLKALRSKKSIPPPPPQRNSFFGHTHTSKDTVSIGGRGEILLAPHKISPAGKETLFPEPKLFPQGRSWLRSSHRLGRRKKKNSSPCCPNFPSDRPFAHRSRVTQSTLPSLLFPRYLGRKKRWRGGERGVLSVRK